MMFGFFIFIIIWAIANLLMRIRSRCLGKDQSLKCLIICYVSNINHCMWSQKYLGLYDYEAKEIVKRKMRIQGNGTALKNGSSIMFFDEST